MSMSPVLLGTPLLNLAENSGVTADAADLGYSFRRPIWIDSINMCCASPVGATNVAMGFSVRCKLNLGRMALTGTRGDGGFVPLWSFGTKRQPINRVDQVRDATVLDGTIRIWSHFKWVLPQPLFVPAGQVLMASFFRQTDGVGGTAQVAISYAGRTSDPKTRSPARMVVPYVCLYEPPAAAATAISSELDLVNPFLVPLHVQRFVMRVLETNGAFQAEGVLSGANRTIQMKDSSGYDVITDATPMLEVGFDATRAWTFNRTLGPKERFIVNYTNLNTAQVVSPTMVMVGWREEVFQ